MKNLKEKKQIVILVIVLLLIGGFSLYMLRDSFIKKPSSSDAKNSVNLELNTYDGDEKIDWSKYEIKDYELSKSIKITEDGVYNLTGTIKDGSITIKTKGNVKLVLNNVSITNSNGPAIYVESAADVVVELVDKSNNYLEDGDNYTVDTNEAGTIYSKSDITFQGSGTLNVISNKKDAIVGKDDLKIVSGTYKISSSGDGIRGKDSVYIKNGNFTIDSKNDAIKSTNETNESKGFVLIENGDFTITSDLDGIEAKTNLLIENGTFNITSGGGKENSTKSQSNGYGNFGKPYGYNNSTSILNGSTKSIKAGNNITIKNGTFNLNTADDGIHSNNYVGIENGDFKITAGDDGIHGDGLVEINGGTYDIEASEGIESTYVKINSGTVSISASDDGINASNKSNEYNVVVEINGGFITIKMAAGDTDGIDSNGNIYVNGGTINITGSSTFDYDGEAKYTGGTIIENGVETNKITNSMMGGPGGNKGGQGRHPGGRR